MDGWIAVAIIVGVWGGSRAAVRSWQYQHNRTWHTVWLRSRR